VLISEAFGSEMDRIEMLPYTCL